MLIDRKIERYVREVTANLPSSSRQRAARDLSEIIYDLVRSSTAGREPDVLDVRAVLKELGSPEAMAVTWMEANQESKREGSPAVLSAAAPLLQRLSGLDRQKLAALMNVFMLAAAALVGFGLLALGTHTINTMLPIFVGCVLALTAVMGRGFLSGALEQGGIGI